jgi:y4mF family transcriptional regulator
MNQKKIYPIRYSVNTILSQFIKQERRRTGLTQEDLAYKAGVGLRFVRDLEQGKPSLRLDKINQVLGLFNHQVGPVPMPRPILKPDVADVP